MTTTHLTDAQRLRRLAILTALVDRIVSDIDSEKKALGAALGRGNQAAFADPDDPTSPELGLLIMPKPRQGSPKIIDEQAAMNWVLSEFNEDESLVEVRLSEQGRKSVLAAAKSGIPVPGVATPPPSAPAPSFRQDADAKAAVAAMWASGQITVADVLAIEEAQQ